MNMVKEIKVLLCTNSMGSSSHNRTLSCNAEQKILPIPPLIHCEAGRVKTNLFVLMGLKMAAVW